MSSTMRMIPLPSSLSAARTKATPCTSGAPSTSAMPCAITRLVPSHQRQSQTCCVVHSFCVVETLPVLDLFHTAQDCVRHSMKVAKPTEETKQVHSIALSNSAAIHLVGPCLCKRAHLWERSMCLRRDLRDMRSAGTKTVGQGDGRVREGAQPVAWQCQGVLSSRQGPQRQRFFGEGARVHAAWTCS